MLKYYNTIHNDHNKVLFRYKFLTMLDTILLVDVFKHTGTIKIQGHFSCFNVRWKNNQDPSLGIIHAGFALPITTLAIC